MDSYLELSRHRRSIRKYTSDPVSEDQLERILQCALMSPSGKRLNPWEFYVVTDPDKVRQLATCREKSSGMFATATAAIVVAVDAQLTDTWQCDGAIAAHSILLAAEDEGLGACWCHIYGRNEAEEIVRGIVHVDSKLTILCVISLGHKDEERKLYEIERLPYQKIHR